MSCIVETEISAFITIPMSSTSGWTSIFSETRFFIYITNQQYTYTKQWWPPELEEKRQRFSFVIDITNTIHVYYYTY